MGGRIKGGFKAKKSGFSVEDNKKKSRTRISEGICGKTTLFVGVAGKMRRAIQSHPNRIDPNKASKKEREREREMILLMRV